MNKRTRAYRNITEVRASTDARARALAFEPAPTPDTVSIWVAQSYLIIQGLLPETFSWQLASEYSKAQDTAERIAIVQDFEALIPLLHAVQAYNNSLRPGHPVSRAARNQLHRALDYASAFGWTTESDRWNVTITGVKRMGQDDYS